VQSFYFFELRWVDLIFIEQPGEFLGVGLDHGVAGQEIFLDAVILAAKSESGADAEDEEQAFY
jgi:hypothetical protein